jgi:hypothetical protein
LLWGEIVNASVTALPPDVREGSAFPKTNETLRLRRRLWQGSPKNGRRSRKIEKVLNR